MHCTRLWCKIWSCPRCGPRNVRRLKRAIIDKATENGLTRFLTLTLDHSVCAPRESPRYIRACWHKFRTYLKRRFGSPISFIAILELNRSGFAHLHVLVDRFIDQRWISRAWESLGGGKIVYINRVNIRNIASYLSNYLTKDLLAADYPNGHGRYTTSRDIKLSSTTHEGKWTLLFASLDDLYCRVQQRVTREIRDNDGALESFDIPFR